MVFGPGVRGHRGGGGGGGVPVLKTASPELDRVRDGGKRALAAALAQIESAPGSAAVQSLLDQAWAAPVGMAVGFTGPPGVGKSSLISALAVGFRERGRRVAVLAVDPSSRRSGGAILGDRTRMDARPEDDGLFIRSLAARDQLGGLAELAMPIMVLFRALFDLVLIETVGVGQSETAIADLADAVIFCAQPGSGDALQFMKAGVVEIPDLAVVCKADMGESASRAVADLKGALALAVRHGSAPLVLKASARDGQGTDALIQRLSAWPHPSTDERRRKAQAWLSTALAARFGRDGLSALGGAPAINPGDSPFALERRAAEDLRRRLGLS